MLTSRIVLFLFIVLVTGETVIGSSFHVGSVYCKNKQCRYRPGVLDTENATAIGTFNDTLHTSGWGVLDVRAGHAVNVTSSNTDVMYAAGFVEGVLTARQMDVHYINVRNAMLPPSKKELSAKLKQWLVENRRWTDRMVDAHRDRRHALWRHVGYVLAQLDGLLEGYTSVSRHVPDPLDQFAMSFLNGLGDWLDLQKILDREAAPDWTKFTQDEARNYFNTQGHCSALIKLLPGFENIFVAHSSWFIYQATNRIYKHYNLNVNDPDTVNKQMSFSSYPGYLESQDDFYLLGSGMAMVQTTINVYNYTLYDTVTPESLLAWQRVLVANMMADNGRDWTSIIQNYNSGTYNNEYMVIDLKKFKPFKPLQDGTLWVANQMPGLVLAKDLTDTLRSGYFPSYNIPYFEEAFNKLGYADYVKKHGLDYSYELAPRAKIFRRDESEVKNLMDMKNLMRYNDYTHDIYSGGSPFGAICSRGDLAKTPGTSGCFDTKVSDYVMANTLTSDVINGPTLGNNLPIFSWTGPFANVSHVGLPLRYNFTFITTQPGFRPEV